MIKKKKHGGGSGGGLSGGPSVVREPLFQGSGAPTFPNTMQSSPYRTRPHPLDSVRNHGRGSSYPTPSPSLWEGTLSPAFDDVDDGDDGDAYSLESLTRKAEKKRREMGWSTSFPAEYHHAHQSRDYQQTLAYQEQLNHRKHQEQQLASAVFSGAAASTSSMKASGSKVSFPSAPSPNRQELELFKQVTMREGILERLKALAYSAGAGGFQTDTGTELLQLLLQLRDASVSVVSAMSRWHQSFTSRMSRPPAFLHQGHNYCAKMVSDLNFLAGFNSLGRVLGVDPARMKQNPFMMPSPITDRDFQELQSHSASSPPRFSFDDPVGRVAEAEKYLVWSLVNLPEGIGHFGSVNANQSSPPAQQPQPPPLSSQGKRDLLTWQQRAEQQLRLLSMPLESPTGQARLMDSSRMMKRKGYLPSLPQSPPKTLTQLMENVHKGGYASPTKSNCFSSLEAYHDGILFRMTALDIEVLGTNEAAPHAIVTLVAASVLILLSPSDRIPKDLSWPSCQKMLSNGLKLIRRIESVDVDAIPAFKWKALLPFLQNEHYHPMFLMEYSSAAATLCAWVLDVLARAQHNDRVAAKSEEDRQELLQELEQQEDEDPSTGATVTEALRPISRGSGSRGGKRVSIGNAEVLFINENEPVSPPSTAPGLDGGSRPSSSGSCSAPSRPRRNVLLRTSPWTHGGVTYFVSFFLEKSDDEPHEVLSIKIYEPMSSVESQMFVPQDDLRLDFGERAAEFFQRREFGQLCDLILTQLNAMLAPSSRGGLSSSSSGSWRRPSVTLDPQEQTAEEVEAAAVRIQSLVRSASAKKELQQLKLEKQSEDEQHAATVRIQCAARQRHARKKVEHVRFTKEQSVAQAQVQSATKIQSLARQRLAKKEVAHKKLLQRRPTGLPTEASPEEDDDEQAGDNETPEEAADEDTIAGKLSAMQTLELTEQDEDDQEQDGEEQASAPPPDHFSPPTTKDDGGAARPETSMSYASDQFEDEFEADDA